MRIVLGLVSVVLESFINTLRRLIERAGAAGDDHAWTMQYVDPRGDSDGLVTPES